MAGFSVHIILTPGISYSQINNETLVPLLKQPYTLHNMINFFFAQIRVHILIYKNNKILIKGKKKKKKIIL